MFGNGFEFKGHVGARKIHSLNFDRTPLQGIGIIYNEYVINSSYLSWGFSSFLILSTNQWQLFQKIDLPNGYCCRITKDNLSDPAIDFSRFFKTTWAHSPQGALWSQSN